MTRPDKYPDWALVDVIEPISGSNNVIEPPSSIKQNGFGYASKVPRQWINYQFRQYDLWIKFLDGSLRTSNQYLNATKPNPQDLGAGNIIYISDLGDGGTLAFSDGTNWRKVSDNSII